MNEKKRKSRKIHRERIPNSLQTRSTERKSSPRESPRLVAAIVALDQHKIPVYRYHRSITDAAKLAREFWHEGWAGVEIYANDPSRWPGLPLQRRGRGAILKAI